MQSHQSTLKRNSGGHVDGKKRKTNHEQRKRKIKQLSEVGVTSVSASGQNNKQIDSKKLSKLPVDSPFSWLMNSDDSIKISNQKVIQNSWNTSDLLPCEDSFRGKQIVIDLYVSDKAIDCTSITKVSSLIDSDESIYNTCPSPETLAFQKTPLLDADNTVNSPNSSSSEEPKQLNFPRLPIPIGPHFQVDVPNWTGPIIDENLCRDDDNLNKSRWLGTRIWPIEGRTKLTYKKEIGEGRIEHCSCVSSGSIDCVKQHILEERHKLQSDIGPAFWSWRFDDMGEFITKSWTSKRHESFDSLVKTSIQTNGLNYWKWALRWLRFKNDKSHSCYYFNVFIPRRMSLKTRLSLQQVDSDDEEYENNDDDIDSQKECEGRITSLAKYRYLHRNFRQPGVSKFI